MSKRGRPVIELSQSDLALVEKSAGLGLTLESIAFLLNISSATLDRKKAELPELEEAYQRGRAIAASSMASRLWDMAMSNDEKGIPTKQAVTAAIFWLKAQSKWSERLQIENTQTESAQVQIYLPENNR